MTQHGPGTRGGTRAHTAPGPGAPNPARPHLELPKDEVGIEVQLEGRDELQLLWRQAEQLPSPAALGQPRPPPRGPRPPAPGPAHHGGGGEHAGGGVGAGHGRHAQVLLREALVRHGRAAAPARRGAFNAPPQAASRPAPGERPANPRATGGARRPMGARLMAPARGRHQSGAAPPRGRGGDSDSTGGGRGTAGLPGWGTAGPATGTGTCPAREPSARSLPGLGAPRCPPGAGGCQRDVPPGSEGQEPLQGKGGGAASARGRCRLIRRVSRSLGHKGPLGVFSRSSWSLSSSCWEQRRFPGWPRAVGALTVSGGAEGCAVPGLRAARAAAAPPSGGAGPAQAPLLEPIKVSRDPAPPLSCWLCCPDPPQPPGLGLQPPWVQTGNGPGAGFVLERAELSSEPS